MLEIRLKLRSCFIFFLLMFPQTEMPYNYVHSSTKCRGYSPFGRNKPRYDVMEGMWKLCPVGSHIQTKSFFCFVVVSAQQSQKRGTLEVYLKPRVFMSWLWCTKHVYQFQQTLDTGKTEGMTTWAFVPLFGQLWGWAGSSLLLATR